MSSVQVEARLLRPGAALSHVGLLVTGAGGVPVRGLEVRVSGDALTRGVVEVARVRARPFSARLAPWERSGWEHSLVPAPGGELWCVLRSARVAPAPDLDTERAASLRVALAHAVWVELEGRALAEGEGDLELRVAPLGAPGEAAQGRVHVRVRARNEPEVLSLYAAWEGSLVERAPVLRRVLDEFALRVAALPCGERVVVARGAAPHRRGLRAGCCVLSSRGLIGDARWRALATRLSSGSIELLSLAPPGALLRADDALEAVVAHAARYSPGPVELVLTVGSALYGECGRAALARGLAAILRTCDPLHGFVAGHDWVPSLLEQTPWERAAGRAPARDITALRAWGRVDPREAYAVVLPAEAARMHEGVLADMRVEPFGDGCVWAERLM